MIAIKMEPLIWMSVSRIFGNGNREPGASISIEVQFQLLWESLILARMR